MTHKQMLQKIERWWKDVLPDLEIECEKVYKITEEVAGITKPYLRVDVVGKNKSDESIFGIECKTIRDHRNFRELAAAIGQAYVIKKIFGIAYIALEVDESFQNKYKLSRYQWLTNINDDLGIGIIFVNKSISIVEEARRDDPEAKTLFLPLKSEFSKYYPKNHSAE